MVYGECMCGASLFNYRDSSACTYPAEDDYFTQTEELNELIDQLTKKRWAGGQRGWEGLRQSVDHK